MLNEIARLLEKIYVYAIKRICFLENHGKHLKAICLLMTEYVIVFFEKKKKNWFLS